MSSEDRREQRRQQTRVQLLEAAREVFSKMGYHEASIFDVTEAANLSKRTFYLHFPEGKESIIKELAFLSFEEVRLQIEADKTEPDEPIETGFRRMAQSIFEYAENNPDLIQMVFGVDASIRLHNMTRDYLVNVTLTHMKEEHECHYIGEHIIPMEVMANAKAGVIFQLLCWWARNPKTYTPAELAEMCVEILFKGTGRFYQKGEAAIEDTINS